MATWINRYASKVFYEAIYYDLLSKRYNFYTLRSIYNVESIQIMKLHSCVNI